MSGILAMLPAAQKKEPAYLMQPPAVPPGFFGTRIAAQVGLISGTFGLESNRVVTQIGPPFLGTLVNFSGAFESGFGLHRRTLEFFNDGDTTFSASYTATDIYVDGLFRLRLNRVARPPGEGCKWEAYTTDAEMGFVNQALHTIDAWYLP